MRVTRLLALLTLLLVAGMVHAQAAPQIPISWDPVTDADLVGYRVYFGTSSRHCGTTTRFCDKAADCADVVPPACTYSGGGSMDVGLVTSAILTVPADCTNYFVAVRALDASGNLSASFSNEFQGWAGVTITAPTSLACEKGKNCAFTIAGTNFRATSPKAWFGPLGTDCSATPTPASCIPASSISIPGGCTSASLSFGLIATGATEGPRVLRWQNQDGTFRDAPGFSIVADAPPGTVSGAKRTDKKE